MGIPRLHMLSQKGNGSYINTGSIISLMGNMIGLPQLVLGFAMLKIFSYNSYQIHLMPLWVFALIVMGLGAIIFGLFFISAMRRALKVSR